MRNINFSVVRSAQWTWVVLAIYAISQFSTIIYLHTHGAGQPNLLCVQLNFRATYLWQILEGWGDQGRQAFLHHLYYDFFHACLYGLSGVVMVRLTPYFKDLSLSWQKYWTCVMPLASCCDFFENMLYLDMVKNFAVGSQVFENTVIVAGLFSTMKWSLALIFVITTIIMIMRYYVAKLTPQK